jgi:DNA-binding transcriptional LysR family regulator
MELLQLQYFQVVGRLEHMTDAAQSLHVTQSSLSKTIQRLEENLGVSLFDRRGRALRLNTFGRTFLARVDKALFELEQGQQEICDLSSPERGSAELAVYTAGGSVWFELCALVAAHPVSNTLPTTKRIIVLLRPIIDVIAPFKPAIY